MLDRGAKIGAHILPTDALAWAMFTLMTFTGSTTLLQEMLHWMLS